MIMKQADSIEILKRNKTAKENSQLPNFMQQTRLARGLDLRACLDTADRSLPPVNNIACRLGTFYFTSKILNIQTTRRYIATLRIRPQTRDCFGAIWSVLSIFWFTKVKLMIFLLESWNKTFTIEPGTCLSTCFTSQLYSRISLSLWQNLNSTERGEGGFGHTG